MATLFISGREMLSPIFEPFAEMSAPAAFRLPMPSPLQGEPPRACRISATLLYRCKRRLDDDMPEEAMMLLRMRVIAIEARRISSAFS